MRTSLASRRSTALTQFKSSSTGKNSCGGARHYERERIFGGAGGEAAEDFVAALVGEQEFPADAVVAVQTAGAGGVIFRPLPLPRMKVPRPTWPWIKPSDSSSA